jgi:5-methylcytosine-specific restriction endonuclease McrA
MSKRNSQWKYIRKLAWERDRKNHAVCGICGMEIDYSLPPSSCETAYEADHIIPVSVDSTKELDLNNIRASHRRCNRARCNGDIVSLGQQSRIW